jgi:polar amino acid transport system substrate-binding protein
MRKIGILVTAALAAMLITGGASAQSLPQDITDSGKLMVGTERDHPPMEFIDAKTNELVGFDVDLIRAIAGKLGLQVEFVHSRFEGLTPNLQSRRINLIISGMYDTPKRRESFDFIDYLSAGTTFYTLDKNTEIQEPKDFCGKVVTTNRGTTYPDSVKKWSDENCVAAGLPAIDVITDTDMASEFLYLNQGRAIGSVQGTEAIPTVLASEDGPFRVVGKPFTNVRIGIGFNKEDTELRDTIFQTLEELFKSGEYLKIVKKWGLEASVLDAPTINAGDAP